MHQTRGVACIGGVETLHSLVHEEGNRELLPIDGEGIQTSS